MMPFDLILNLTNRSRQSLQVSRGSGTNWLRLGAVELLTMRRWCCSTLVEELEVEEWVESLPPRAPPPPQASCDSSHGARVLLARELAGLRRRCVGETHERRWWGRVGCGGARGCLRQRLGLGASEQVSEWVSDWLSQTAFRPEIFRQVCWRLA
jgi:hypothetical protein